MIKEDDIVTEAVATDVSAAVVPLAPRPQDVIGSGDSHSSSKFPRWRLAREGTFLAEWLPSALRAFGAGSAFRRTTYRASDYVLPSGAFGVPLNHPRFLE